MNKFNKKFSNDKFETRCIAYDRLILDFNNITWCITRGLLESIS